MSKGGEYCHIGFIANFIHFLTVQKFWKSVKFWWSYRQFKGGNFFETQCSCASAGHLQLGIRCNMIMHRMFGWVVSNADWLRSIIDFGRS